MHQLRDVVVRLRSGQSERKTARAAGMGRDRVAQIRERARKLGSDLLTRGRTEEVEFGFIPLRPSE